MSLTEKLLDAGCEYAPHFVNPDYEDAIIGFTHDGRIVYDYDKMIEYLMDKEGWSDIDAIEWIDYNVIRSIPYMGSNAPIVMYSVD